MKISLALCASIAIWAANASPIVPEDNGHYVEGESRYIWMPDGEGVPHLVDLQAPVEQEILRNRNGANNEYLLFTRVNPTIPQYILDGNPSTVFYSTYGYNKPLKVLVHGWNGSANSRMNPQMTAAILAAQDVNVIVVDWRDLSNSLYVTAMNGSPGVGRYLGNFLNWLMNTTGGSWSNVHLIGFSLGAHIVGNAGRTVNGQPARITGLDPAGPLWWGSSNAIRSSDGRYVEGIHTDGRLLGILDPVGNADFYPNGGRHPQPGCDSSSCSHSRAPELMSASIQYNHFIGRQCNNLNEAQNVQCSGGIYNMGNTILSKQGNGIFSLTTGANWPF